MPKGEKNVSTWQAGKTTSIRVPESKKVEILALLRTLDSIGWEYKVIDKESYSQAITTLKQAVSLPSITKVKLQDAITEALFLLGNESE